MSTATPIDGGSKGFIHLHRKILDNPLFKDKPAAWFKIWIYILLRANWRESVFRPRQGEGIIVPAGLSRIRAAVQDGRMRDGLQ